MRLNLDGTSGTKSAESVSGCLIAADTCHECLAANDPECYWNDGQCGSQIGLHKYAECGALTEQIARV